MKHSPSFLTYYFIHWLKIFGCLPRPFFGCLPSIPPVGGRGGEVWIVSRTTHKIDIWLYSPVTGGGEKLDTSVGNEGDLLIKVNWFTCGPIQLELIIFTRYLRKTRKVAMPPMFFRFKSEKVMIAAGL